MENEFKINLASRASATRLREPQPPDFENLSHQASRTSATRLREPKFRINPNSISNLY
jgi:hypothetical protein